MFILFFSFTLCPACNGVGTERLVLRHSSSHFPPKSGGTTCRVAVHNAALYLDIHTQIIYEVYLKFQWVTKQYNKIIIFKITVLPSSHVQKCDCIVDQWIFGARSHFLLINYSVICASIRDSALHICIQTAYKWCQYKPYIIHYEIFNYLYIMLTNLSYKIFVTVKAQW